MPLVKAQCPNCMGNLDVDNTKDAAICPFCGTPFIVEKAIQNISNYINNTNYIQNAIFSNEPKKESADELWNKALKFIKYDEYKKASEVFDLMLTEYIDDSRPVEYLIETTLNTYYPATGKPVYFYYSNIIHDLSRPDFILNRYYIMFPDRKKTIHERLFDSFKNCTLEEYGFVNFFSEFINGDSHPIYNILRSNAQYANKIITEKFKSTQYGVFKVFIVEFDKILYGDDINTSSPWEMMRFYKIGICKGIYGQYLVHSISTVCGVSILKYPIYTKKDIDNVVKEAEKRTISLLKSKKMCTKCGEGKIGLMRVCNKCGKLNL